MKISNITIENIRNHKFTNIEFNDNLNILYGLNGAGKTSILEAISICGFSKSFLPINDSSLILDGRNEYNIVANAFSDNGIPYKVTINYEKGSRKKISSTLGDNLTAKDIIGDLPMVILSPDYKLITFGSPENRRSFIDRILSQISKLYIENLLKYRRALKQRNSLLNEFNITKRFEKSQIEPWTELLIQIGTEILVKRLKFIEEFKELFLKYYQIVSSGKEKVDLIYKLNGFDVSLKTITSELIDKELRKLFNNAFNEEYRRGITLYGPHKDDILIMINGGVAKEFASQGQHKSLLIALKMGEFDFLKNKRNETPIVLLDDIFSELDAERIEKVLNLINENETQTMITITHPLTLEKLLINHKGISYFKVNDGVVNKL